MADGLPSNPSYPSGPVGPAAAPGGTRQPSTLPVWLGVVVLLVGVGGSIVWFVTGLVGLANHITDMPRLSVPGRATLQLSQGSYRIYAEYPGATSDPGPADDLGPISVTDHLGSPLDVQSNSLEETYSVGAHEGRLVGRFTAPSDGSYTVAITESGGLNGSSVAGMELAVSKGPALFSGATLTRFGLALLLGALERAGRRGPVGGGAHPSQPLASQPDGAADADLGTSGAGSIRADLGPRPVGRPARWRGHRPSAVVPTDRTPGAAAGLAGAAVRFATGLARTARRSAVRAAGPVGALLAGAALRPAAGSSG